MLRLGSGMTSRLDSQMSSSDLVSKFSELSLSSTKLVALNKKPLNVCANLNEFSSFDPDKYSSRVLLSHRDMSNMGLKAGSLVRIRYEESMLENIFEVWPSILTKINDITFGSANLFSWLKLRCGEKVDLLMVDFVSKPVLPAKIVQINSPHLENSSHRSLILQWLKKNHFSEKSVNFTISDGQEIIFCIKVLDVTNSGLYRFEQNETIIQQGSEVAKSTLSFKFGGLETQYKEIFNTINAYFEPKNNLNSYQVKVPHGILLHGPPGCGKTMLVKIISESMNIPVVYLTASDLSSGDFGDAEKKLKELFISAKNSSPCIIFMDEVDSLCPKRDSHSNATSQRITTLLLTFMDGCSNDFSKSKIFFIGASNMPSSLDPAMRRPGRFDREIEIPPPSSNDRYYILKSILDKYPNNVNDSDLKTISDMTHGYVGSDLNLLCKESYLDSIKNNKDNDSTVTIIRAKNIRNAISKIRPSAMREVYVEVPQVKWTDIGGQKMTKEKLIECVEWPIKFPEKFEKLGINPPKGILLFGPPGCSKTLLAKALASESGLNFLAVKGPEIFSKYIGESEKKIRDIFKKARQASPSIIFFDEFDSIAGRSNSGDNSSVSNRVMSQLLNEMDGLEPLVNVIIIAATNKPDLIDKALLRPGRLDRHIYVSLPDLESRIEIFKILLKRMPFDNSFTPENMAHLTEGFSGAEITSLCQNAAIKSLERDVSNQVIEWKDFKLCLSKFEKQINSESLKIFEKFIE